MTRRINKAVFPVAGLGTRILPATKVLAKEMLTLVDRPIIQHAVEDALSAGITELIFVTAESKQIIRDHFRPNPRLEQELAQRGKQELLERVKNIPPPGISCDYVLQHEPLGLGHAVLCAKSLVGEEPFAVILPDDLIHNEEGTCLQQMMEIYRETDSNVVAVENVAREQVFPLRDRRDDWRSRRRRKDEVHRGETRSGRSALHPGGGGTLHLHAGDHAVAGNHTQGRGKRDPVDRCHRAL